MCEIKIVFTHCYLWGVRVSSPFYDTALTLLPSLLRHTLNLFISIFAGPQTRKSRYQPRLWAQGIDVDTLTNQTQRNTTRHVSLCQDISFMDLFKNGQSITINEFPRISFLSKSHCVSCQILDFGLARQADSEMTGYVVTRWYRAPEVILSWMHYTQTGNEELIKSSSITASCSVLPVSTESSCYFMMPHDLVL